MSSGYPSILIRRESSNLAFITQSSYTISFEYPKFQPNFVVNCLEILSAFLLLVIDTNKVIVDESIITQIKNLKFWFKFSIMVLITNSDELNSKDKTEIIFNILIVVSILINFVKTWLFKSWNAMIRSLFFFYYFI